MDACSARVPSTGVTQLPTHTHCLGLTATTLRVAVRADKLRAWVLEGWLDQVDAALESITDGAHDLALIPVEENADLRSDPTNTLATFVTSPANQRARDIAERFWSSSHDAPSVLLHGPAGPIESGE